MSERGVFELRLWIEGETTLDVWRKATALQRAARLFAGPGVQVRWVQLKDGEKTRGDFQATMRPKQPKRKRAA